MTLFERSGQGRGKDPGRSSDNLSLIGTVIFHVMTRWKTAVQRFPLSFFPNVMKTCKREEQGFSFSFCPSLFLKVMKIFMTVVQRFSLLSFVLLAVILLLLFPS